MNKEITDVAIERVAEILKEMLPDTVENFSRLGLLEFGGKCFQAGGQHAIERINKQINKIKGN